MATATGASRLRELMVDSPSSVGARRRAGRWELFARLFPSVEQMRVLDLGGTTEAWRRAPVRPADVVVLNLLEPGESTEPWLHPVLGDACTARRSLEEAGAPTAYDLVFSNSLIEHVGGHAQRAALAREVHALAPRHWVQTPYRYFPLEPHWLCPGLQFLPLGARARVAAVWPLAHTRPGSREDAFAEVQWTELIGLAELRAYFPRSQIHHERMAGLTKSLTAVAT
ncbi:methyltransferase type 11 [Nocardioides sp. dk4132]|uniref:methyltransferase type 11 n=1 Tax=unclassified Nocardioides TaxID=2615069 RepID=UPI001295A81E|nr:MULTISPECIES: methyltransferase type 11 [unclassified Nocardioides]MQW74799.1 methyltransferase type 11 [Nocardioides sp. dk4132]QGA06691.1 methyltransferase type 11 [Nocardioides sp. dk884]